VFIGTTTSIPPPMCTLPPAAYGVLRPAVPPSAVSQADVDYLRTLSLAIPVVGVARDDLHDTFADLRNSRRHEAIDLAAAIGTPVVAVEDGTIAKLFRSDAGGLTIYHLDPSSTYVYYYAHLDRYADGLRDGHTVVRGEVIGYVGTTGNAGATPHLHFAILKLGPEKRWWEGAPVNPYLVLGGVD
jgi:murein DD-endopeptidase MepM/ murein hydrolase activator NlpD